ncbi:MAG TPA: DegT/DnrJ/EryC1/StrS family aminotransferase, partial [Terriglobia bacterium]|nr:DegT/DnrJ/EryC1/StrS family aminotransferase [Terriglobia bacterium]
MKVPLLDLKIQYAAIRDEVREALDRVIESQHFILGPEVEALEKEVAEYSQCRFAVGLSSGTDALLAALMAFNIGAGDEVLTTSYSFFATAGVIARLGATPVFVDIDPETFNIDPSTIEAAITNRTRAIIPVHLYGQLAEMDAILDIGRKHGIPIIEDAAQAIGAEQNGKRAGSLGEMGCLSFFPSKNLGGFGDGGMAITNNAELAERLVMLRNHGFRTRYHNEILGGNFRLDAI